MPNWIINNWRQYGAESDQWSVGDYCGAEDKKGLQDPMEFVRRASIGWIVVMTADELPREVGENYIRVFERLGAENVRIVDTVTREDAFIYWVEAQKHWRIFYWGDQARITSILKDTEIDASFTNATLKE